jgi:hypothetical protein
VRIDLGHARCVARVDQKHGHRHEIGKLRTGFGNRLFYIAPLDVRLGS